MQEEEETEEPKPKKMREQNGNDSELEQHQPDGHSSPLSSGFLGATCSNTENNNHDSNCKVSTTTRRIETGIFSKIPPELFPHILKFLSSEVTPNPSGTNAFPFFPFGFSLYVC